MSVICPFQDHQELNVPVASICIPEVKLRGVQKKLPEFLDLVASIKKDGVLDRVSVRPEFNNETSSWDLFVVDGLQRLSAAQEAGLTEIPVVVLDINLKEANRLQIVKNAQRMDTRKADYAKHLWGMAKDGGYTVSEIAAMIGKTVKWVEDMCSLGRKVKDKAINSLINDGKINYANALTLARLDEQDQPQFTLAAQSEKSDKFAVTVADFLKQQIAARRGITVAAPEFRAEPKLRKIADLAPLSEPGRAPVEGNEDTFAAGIAFALSLDAATVARARSEWEADQALKAKKREEEAAKREEARKAKAAAEQAAANA